MPIPKDKSRNSRDRASGAETPAGRRERCWFEDDPGAALPLDLTLTGGEAAVVRRFGGPNVTIASALRHALRLSCEVAEAKRRALSMEQVAHRQADYLRNLVNHMNQLNTSLTSIFEQQAAFFEHYRHPGKATIVRPIEVSERTQATLENIDRATALLVRHLAVLDGVLTAAIDYPEVIDDYPGDARG